MKCEFTKKVSAMLDGELPESETAALLEHIRNCADCAAAKADFELLRMEIQGLAIDERTLLQEPSLVRRRVLVPAPAIAAAALVVVVLVSVLVVSLLRSPEPDPPFTRAETPPATRGSLARFDGGGKAAVFKEARR
ncbi:MAG TPA: zf-HC2 domain-containing protein [Aridibacter sp.]|nr:zf-HC2 domain-containing protein [Aridibacter sp.]